MTINNNLQEIRKKHGYSQLEVAEKLGVSRQTYLKMESEDGQINVKQLKTLSDLYGIPIEEFFYEPQNIEKFKQMYFYILSKFTERGIQKTKLAKLLYLCDFSYFYKNLKSMSGVLYKCKQYGPLADPFAELTDELQEEGKIRIDYLTGGANMVCIKTTAYDNHYDLLSDDEIKQIDEICDLWKDISVNEIVNYTHSQKPWMACRENEIIPYSLILQEEPNHVYTPVTK